MPNGLYVLERRINQNRMCFVGSKVVVEGVLTVPVPLATAENIELMRRATRGQEKRTQ